MDNIRLLRAITADAVVSIIKIKQLSPLFWSVLAIDGDYVQIVDCLKI